MILGREVPANRISGCWGGDVTKMFREPLFDSVLGLAYILEIAGFATDAIDNVIAVAGGVNL